MTPTPPAPPGWNRTMADLAAEMARSERLAIGWPESQWAIDYELSLLPPDTRFPRQGDIYEALQDLDVTVLIARAVPFTDSRPVRLLRGERIVVDGASERPLTVYATAVDEQSLRRRALPWWMRLLPVRMSLYFALDTAVLNRQFRHVPALRASR